MGVVAYLPIRCGSQSMKVKLDYPRLEKPIHNMFKTTNKSTNISRFHLCLGCKLKHLLVGLERPGKFLWRSNENHPGPIQRSHIVLSALEPKASA